MYGKNIDIVYHNFWITIVIQKLYTAQAQCHFACLSIKHCMFWHAIEPLCSNAGDTWCHALHEKHSVYICLEPQDFNPKTACKPKLFALWELWLFSIGNVCVCTGIQSLHLYILLPHKLSWAPRWVVLNPFYSSHSMQASIPWVERAKPLFANMRSCTQHEFAHREPSHMQFACPPINTMFHTWSIHGISWRNPWVVTWYFIILDFDLSYK